MTGDERQAMLMLAQGITAMAMKLDRVIELLVSIEAASYDDDGDGDGMPDDPMANIQKLMQHPAVAPFVAAQRAKQNQNPDPQNP